jgi:hypothetical protein
MRCMTRKYAPGQYQFAQGYIDTTSSTKENKVPSAYPIINLLLSANPHPGLELIKTVEITPLGRFR